MDDETVDVRDDVPEMMDAELLTRGTMSLGRDDVPEMMDG
jgi:hypothetical protein